MRSRSLLLLLLVALVPAVLLALPMLAAARQAVALPPQLRAFPADPRPGTQLPEEGATQVWAVLQSLDGPAGFGTARGEADGKPIAFRLLPYASLRRFGAPGATPGEFPLGLRVRLELLPPPGAAPGSKPVYARVVEDEITGQLRAGATCRIVNQDIPRRQLTVLSEPRSGAGDRAMLPPQEPTPSALSYTPKIILVLLADPVYTFRVAPETRLLINSGYPEGSTTRTAIEVLDEPSARRFQEQQRLRLLARAQVAGAPGYLVDNGPGGARVLIFPDYAEWVRGLAQGEVLEFTSGGRSTTGRVKTPVGSGPALLNLEAPLSTLGVNAEVVIRRASRRADFERDIRPMLEGNCLPCHGGGAARGGFSIESAERLQRGGARGPGIVPGKSDGSLLYLLLSGDRNPVMPPDRPPTADQLFLLKSWIDAGAPAGIAQGATAARA